MSGFRVGGGIGPQKAGATAFLFQARSAAAPASPDSTPGVAAIRRLRIMMRFLARFLAVVLAAAFVVVAVAAVLVRPLGTQLLNPQTYKNVLRETRFAERVPELASEMIAKAAVPAGPKSGGGKMDADFSGFLSGFEQTDLQILVEAVLPADYVRGQTDGAIDQFLGYMNSEMPRPSVKLSLVDLKRRLSGGVLEDAYVKVLQSKPPCGAEARWMPTACCPPPEQLPEVRARFREMVAPAATEMPDSVELFAVREGSQAERVFTALAQLRSRLRLSVAVARWLWVGAAVLLLGVAAFGVRSLRGLLVWWGVPCLIAGGIALLCTLPGAALGGLFYRVLIEPNLPPEVPAVAVETVFGIATALLQVVLGAALKSALWLGLGGFVAVVLAVFLKPRPKAA
jgi:hypothetical protein